MPRTGETNAKTIDTIAADIKLALFDSSKLPEMDAHTKELLDENTIVIISKSDAVIPALSVDLKQIKTEFLALNPRIRGDYIVEISALTNQGIDDLLARIEEKVRDCFAYGASSLITRARHRALLGEAELLLAAAVEDKELELSCEELRRAALAIGKITGKIQVDDVLDVIFSQFCIGK